MYSISQFFMPDVTDAKKVEDCYSRIKKHWDLTVGWKVSEKRIFKIKHRYNGDTIEAVVGRCYQPIGEKLIMILEPREYPILEGTFILFTYSRGIAGEPPVLISSRKVIEVTYFS